MSKLKIAGLITLALVILIAGLYGAMRSVFSNRFDMEIAKIKAKGEPVTIDDLNNPKVPDNENAVVVYEQIGREQLKTQADERHRLIQEEVKQRRSKEKTQEDIPTRPPDTESTKRLARTVEEGVVDSRTESAPCRQNATQRPNASTGGYRTSSSSPLKSMATGR